MRLPEQVIEDMAKVQAELKNLQVKRENLLKELHEIRDYVNAALSGLQEPALSELKEPADGRMADHTGG